MRRFLEIEPAGRAGFLAVRFYARGASLFFRRPREWTERIVLAKAMEARVRFIERALLSLLSKNGRTEPAVDRALQIIEATRGQVRIDELAAEIGVSCRHLTRQFERAVGLSPKEFGRVAASCTPFKS